MGFFDGFQPSGGSPSGGGLLDFLRQFTSQNGTAPQYGNPNIDPSAMQQPAPQMSAAPDQSPSNMIPIGGYNGYMMPSFGMPSGGPAAPTGALPAQQPPAMNANAQMPQQAPQAAGTAPAPLPSFLQPQSSPGGFGGAMRGMMANAQGGPLGMLFGGVAGGMGMGQGNPQQQELEQKRQLFQALAADPNIGPNKAMIAVSNPQIFGQLQAQLNSDRDFAEKKREFGMTYGLSASREARANQSPAEAAAERAKAAQQYGVQPGTPEYNAYVLNGTLPDPTKNGGVQVLGKGGELYKVGSDGQPEILHKNTENQDATLSDETVKSMAGQYLAGDRTVLQNLGRGAQGAANVVKVREAIHQAALDAGIDPKGIVQNFNEQAGALAGQRAVGTRAANISLAANEANNMIPIALAASDKLPRTQYMPWNQMVQAVQKGTSSPELASFVAATNSLVNSYVRAVSPSGVPTDSMREHAYSMLNAAQGPEAYKAVIATMKQEMGAALQAPSQVKKELRGGDAGGEQPSGAKSDPLGIR